MKRPWRNYLIIPSISLFIIIFVTWLLTPIIGKHYLIKYFAEQGEDASLAKLSVDFFPPKVSLEALEVTQDGQQTLALDNLTLGIRLLPLFSKHIYVTDADIDGLTLDVKQQQQRWFVAGIDLSQYQQQAEQETTEKEATEDHSTPWSVSVPSFRFTDSAVHLARQLDDQSSPLKDTLTINQLAIDDLHGAGLDWQGDIQLNALLNNAQFRLSSEIKYTPHSANAHLMLGNNRLPIEDFSHFLPAPYQQGRGVISINGELALSFLANDALSSYSLSQSNLTINTDELALPLGNAMSVRSKKTQLDLSDLSVTFSTDTAVTASGKLMLTSQDSAFVQDQNLLAYQDLELQSALVVKRQQASNDIKSQQTKIRLQGVKAKQDNQQVDVADLQVTLDDFLANIQDDISRIKLNGQVSSRLSELSAQLPDEQTAQLESVALQLPFEISKTPTELSANSEESHAAIKGLSVALTSLLLNNESTDLSLSKLSAKQTTDEQTSLAFDSKITSAGLFAQQADNQIAYQTLDWSNSLHLSQKQQSTDINSQLFDLAIKQLKLDQEGTIHSTLGATTLTAEQLDVHLENQQEPKISGHKINLTSNDMDSKLSPEKRAAAWDSANLANLELVQQGKDFTAQLAQLVIKNLVVSSPLKGDNPTPLATLSHLEINQVNANQAGANIKSIATQDLISNVLMDKERRITNLVFIDPKQQTPPAAATSNPAAPKEKDAKKVLTTQEAAQQPAFKAPYYIILDAFDLTGQSSVHLEDNGVKPALRRTLDISKLSLRNLNTKDPEQAATLAVELKHGKYSTLDGDLKIWPMADELTMQSELKVSQAELPPYSPYIASVLGYQIDSGQLNLDLKLDAEQGELSGNSHLVLKQFDLGGSYESGSAIKAGVIPLNMAVSALKDSDNNIDLDIPLSGNIDSPSFGWGDFLFIPVKKALFQASSSYLLQTFVPYANVITVAQFASDQLLKIRVQPLIYKPQEISVDGDQTVFLKQLVALLKDKTQSELRICGVANYQDIELEQPPASVDEQMRHQANALAEARAHHLKDYLVSQDIDSARLFICSPELDFSKNSQPRVELNF
ncbi:DUF748 domain-containing protein [Marinomonas pollencensis]|uniref:Uncharacterized protein DUF748 n=1 Tax=Marinomonas pollencensis TaxID=491954 RepID=A0A3E0DT06_9GAMM|nr:DUF748 domain-containing protein [Marinomonas pollencensis]REG86620.1 uncharacterized protein DUF748 [Marinomonas pollencensis]